MRHRFEHPWMHGHHWMYGQHWLPGIFLSVLTTAFLAALLIGLAWILLRWVLPYILPVLADIFSWPPSENPPALEILRQRYAAGEIDAVTFEQMRERLEASYPRGTWTGYRTTFSRPGTYGTGTVKMSEQEQHPHE